MQLDNPALFVTADHQIRMEQSPIGEPGAGEVLLHVCCTGICGSDVHFWQHGGIGDITVDGTCILGHEASGIVVQVGENVKNVKQGDRVAVEPGVPCGTCFLCSAGRYNLCESVAFSGVYPYDGTIQRYKVHSAKFVHKIPDSMTFASAAMLEPLSVALHALRTSPISVGTPVAVFGAGPIGLLTMAAARASGAYPIVITDVDQSRLDFAKNFEPSCLTHQVRGTPEETGAQIRQLFGDDETTMPSLVLECTGVEASIITAGFTVKRGGAINVVGVSPKMSINNVPFMKLSLVEIKLLFINRYTDTWPAAIRAVHGGLISGAKLDSMVSHVFKLEDAVEALQLVGGKARDGVVKVQIVDDETATGVVL